MTTPFIKIANELNQLNTTAENISKKKISALEIATLSIALVALVVSVALPIGLDKLAADRNIQQQRSSLKTPLMQKVVEADKAAWDATTAFLEASTAGNAYEVNSKRASMTAATESYLNATYVSSLYMNLPELVAMNRLTQATLAVQPQTDASPAPSQTPEERDQQKQGHDAARSNYIKSVQCVADPNCEKEDH